ncbi:hypothetical protein EPN28_04850 [Patescibacteria group bacterium]|nr:MAG: hypothetical protein EPN28_04850 [Patescibacteria group bacterium]
MHKWGIFATIKYHFNAILTIIFSRTIISPNCPAVQPFPGERRLMTRHICCRDGDCGCPASCRGMLKRRGKKPRANKHDKRDEQRDNVGLSRKRRMPPPITNERTDYVDGDDGVIFP